MDIIILCMLIFIGTIINQALGTLRTLFIINEKKWYTVIASFLEITIWFVLAKTVLLDNDNIYTLITYCVAYVLGTMVGSYIEEKLSIGHLSVQIIVSTKQKELVHKLKEENFGITASKFHGINKEQLMILTEINRKDLKYLKKIVNEINDKAFITVNDTKTVINGYVKLHK